MPRCASSNKDWTQQFNQPAEILRRDDMECPTHQPAANDRSFDAQGVIDVGGTQAGASNPHPERRRTEDLRLQREHLAQDGRWTLAPARILGQALGRGAHR
jgi:hypothetical protein